MNRAFEHTENNGIIDDNFGFAEDMGAQKFNCEQVVRSAEPIKYKIISIRNE